MSFTSILETVADYKIQHVLCLGEYSMCICKECVILPLLNVVFYKTNSLKWIELSYYCSNLPCSYYSPNLVVFTILLSPCFYFLCSASIYFNDISFKKNISVQFSSVIQSCLILCNPMDCSTPGLPVRRRLLEFTQTHVHWVSDAIQPSYPLSSPSPALTTRWARVWASSASWWWTGKPGVL